MSEAETPRVDTGGSSTGEFQQTQQGTSSDFNRVRADAAELGKNGVGDLLKCSVENDYGKGNPKITSDIVSRMGIIRQITTKNGRNSKGELLGIEELILWAGESGDQREKTLRAYSVYLYLEEEIAGIPDELKESKRDYIIFLGEKIVELSGAIGASKKTRFGKILPTVRRYALAVTSVVALGSLGYARHLKVVYEERWGALVEKLTESESKFSKKELELLSNLALREEFLKNVKTELEKAKDFSDHDIEAAIWYEGFADIYLYRLHEIEQYPELGDLFRSYEDKIKYIVRFPTFTKDIPIIERMLNTKDSKTGKEELMYSKTYLERFIRGVDEKFYKEYPNHKKRREGWMIPPLPR